MFRGHDARFKGQPHVSGPLVPPSGHTAQVLSPPYHQPQQLLHQQQLHQMQQRQHVASVPMSPLSQLPLVPPPAHLGQEPPQFQNQPPGTTAPLYWQNAVLAHSSAAAGRAESGAGAEVASGFHPAGMNMPEGGHTTAKAQRLAEKLAQMQREADALASEYQAALSSAQTATDKEPATSGAGFMGSGYVVPPTPMTVRKRPPAPGVSSEQTDLEIKEVQRGPRPARLKSDGPTRRGSQPLHLSLDQIQECFGMPIVDAAARLGVGLTVLKKLCRQYGVPRWPHRKMKSLECLISNIEAIAANDPEQKLAAETNSTVNELRTQHQIMLSDPGAAMEERTRRLRQAFFKASYKHRHASARASGLPGRPVTEANEAEIEKQRIAMEAASMKLQEHLQMQSQAAAAGCESGDVQQVGADLAPSGVALPPAMPPLEIFPADPIEP